MCVIFGGLNMFEAVKAGILASSILLAACQTTTGATSLAGPATSGGAVGAACTTEGGLGCAPGAKGKVKCQGGKWVDDGACNTGETCSETKQSGSVTATTCAVPPASDSNRAIACAKAGFCMNTMGFSDCMTPMSPTILANLWHAMGVGVPQSLVTLEFASHAGCVGAAKDCAGVRACFATGAPACQNDNDSACFGSVARVCESGGTITTDCADIGMSCSKMGNQAICGTLPACSAPSTVKCQGNKAQLCMPNKTGGAVALVVDCDALGGKCDPAANPMNIDSVCNGGEPTCDRLTFTESCQGTRATACKLDPSNPNGGGHVMVQDCATYGAVCEFKAGNGQPGEGKATCTTTPNCVGDVGCTGGIMHYCEGSQGLHSFDCATAGMVCGSSNACEFAP